MKISAGNGTVVDANIVLSHLPRVSHADGSNGDSSGNGNGNGTPAKWKAGRDCWWHEEMKEASEDCPVEWLSAEDPLFIVYTSGSTGKPKGVMLTQVCNQSYDISNK